jgi:hypothetical protein
MMDGIRYFFLGHESWIMTTPQDNKNAPVWNDIRFWSLLL